MNLADYLNNSTNPEDVWNFLSKWRPASRRLLPVATSKSHPPPPHGQLVQNRPQPQPLCLFLPALILIQMGAACGQFHCGALHSQRSTRDHNSISSSSLSVLSNMVHRMRCLRDAICLLHPQVLYCIKTHSCYTLHSEAVTNAINTVDSSFLL